MKNDWGYKGLVDLEANLEHFYLQEKRGIRLFPLSRVRSTLGLPLVAFALLVRPATSLSSGFCASASVALAALCDGGNPWCLCVGVGDLRRCPGNLLELCMATSTRYRWLYLTNEPISWTQICL